MPAQRFRHALAQQPTGSAIPGSATSVLGELLKRLVDQDRRMVITHPRSPAQDAASGSPLCLPCAEHPGQSYPAVVGTPPSSGTTPSSTAASARRPPLSPRKLGRAA